MPGPAFTFMTQNINTLRPRTEPMFTDKLSPDHFGTYFPSLKDLQPKKLKRIPKCSNLYELFEKTVTNEITNFRLPQINTPSQGFRGAKRDIGKNTKPTFPNRLPKIKDKKTVNEQDIQNFIQNLVKKQFRYQKQLKKKWLQQKRPKSV